MQRGEGVMTNVPQPHVVTLSCTALRRGAAASIITQVKKIK